MEIILGLRCFGTVGFAYENFIGIGTVIRIIGDIFR